MDAVFRENTLDARTFQIMRSGCSMPPLDDRLLEKALKGTLFTITAVLGAKTIGMLRVTGDGAYVFLICDVLVLPEYRRKGLGSRLIELALDRIEAMLPAGMWVTVNLFSAPGKEDFYRRLGFHALPNQHFGAGMQIILKATGPRAPL